MKTQLLILAFIAVSITACQKDVTAPATPAKLHITAVKITGLPAERLTLGPRRRPESKAWDSDGSGPDVYITIADSAARTVYTSAPVNNVTVAPVSFSLLTPGYELSPTAGRYIITVSDRDKADADNNDDDFMGLASFSVDEWEKEGCPATMKLQCSLFLQAEVTVAYY